MAFLSQFLAALANDIRKSKLLVDLDTARQSTRFLKDEFLRLLPITRIDFDSVKLRFKMAVGEVVLKSEESPFLAALTSNLTPKYVNITKKREMEPEVLSRPIIESAVMALAPELSEISPSRFPEIRESLSDRFSQNIADKYTKMVPESTEVEKKQVSRIAKGEFVKVLDRYAKTYKEDMAAELLKELGRLDVVVEGHRLREFPPDALVELELNLVSKTYHWSLKPEYIDKPEAPEEEKYELMPGG